MRTPRFRIVAFLLIATVAFDLPAMADINSGDTSAVSLHPNTPQGAGQSLFVTGATGSIPSVGSNATAYVTFTTPFIPASSTIARAEVVLYVNQVYAAGAVDVYLLLDPWDEATLTYNNRPRLGPQVLSGVAVNKAGYVSLNVTSAYQANLAGNGFAIVANPGTPSVSLDIDSKESTATSHAAALDVVLSSGLIPRGAWSPLLVYSPNDLVTYGGSAYVATARNSGQTPDSSASWQLYVSKGDQGIQGPAGPQGPQGPQGPPGTVGQSLTGDIAVQGNITMTPLNGVNPLFKVQDADGSTFTVGANGTFQTSTGSGGSVSASIPSDRDPGGSLAINGNGGVSTGTGNGSSVNISGGIGTGTSGGQGGNINISGGGGSDAGPGGNINLTPGSGMPPGVVNVFGDLQVKGFISFPDGSTLASGTGTQGPAGPPGPVGPQGPAGPQGPPGTVDLGALDARYVQASPGGTTTQTVNSNLNVNGSISLASPNGAPAFSINGNSGTITQSDGTITTTGGGKTTTFRPSGIVLNGGAITVQIPSDPNNPPQVNQFGFVGPNGFTTTGAAPSGVPDGQAVELDPVNQVATVAVGGETYAFAPPGVYFLMGDDVFFNPDNGNITNIAGDAGPGGVLVGTVIGHPGTIPEIHLIQPVKLQRGVIVGVSGGNGVNTVTDPITSRVTVSANLPFLTANLPFTPVNPFSFSATNILGNSITAGASVTAPLVFAPAVSGSGIDPSSVNLNLNGISLTVGGTAGTSQLQLLPNSINSTVVGDSSGTGKFRIATASPTPGASTSTELSLDGTDCCAVPTTTHYEWSLLTRPTGSNAALGSTVSVNGVDPTYGSVTPFTVNSRGIGVAAPAGQPVITTDTAFDSQGNPFTYEWKIVAPPLGSRAQLTTSMPDANGDPATVYTQTPDETDFGGLVSAKAFTAPTFNFGLPQGGGCSLSAGTSGNLTSSCGADFPSISTPTFSANTVTANNNFVLGAGPTASTFSVNTLSGINLDKPIFVPQLTTGNAAITGNVGTGTLQVTNDASVGGNLNLGKTLDVAGLFNAQNGIQVGGAPVVLNPATSPTATSTAPSLALRQTAARLNDSGFPSSSFFDMFTEVSLDGGQTWSLAAGNDTSPLQKVVSVNTGGSSASIDLTLHAFNPTGPSNSTALKFESVNNNGTANTLPTISFQAMPSGTGSPTADAILFLIGSSDGVSPAVPMAQFSKTGINLPSGENFMINNVPIGGGGGGVTSVNGETGAVTITPAKIGAVDTSTFSSTVQTLQSTDTTQSQQIANLSTTVASAAQVGMSNTFTAPQSMTCGSAGCTTLTDSCQAGSGQSCAANTDQVSCTSGDCAALTGSQTRCEGGAGGCSAHTTTMSCPFGAGQCGPNVAIDTVCDPNVSDCTGLKTEFPGSSGQALKVVMGGKQTAGVDAPGNFSGRSITTDCTDDSCSSAMHSCQVGAGQSCSANSDTAACDDGSCAQVFVAKQTCSGGAGGCTAGTTSMTCPFGPGQCGPNVGSHMVCDPSVTDCTGTDYDLQDNNLAFKVMNSGTQTASLKATGDFTGNILSGTQFCLGGDCRMAWPSAGATYTAGTGISISPTNVISNTGVTGLTAGSNVAIAGTSVLTVSVTPSVDVTSVNASVGFTGGTGSFSAVSTPQVTSGGAPLTIAGTGSVTAPTAVNLQASNGSILFNANGSSNGQMSVGPSGISINTPTTVTSNSGSTSGFAITRGQGTGTAPLMNISDQGGLVTATISNGVPGATTMQVVPASNGTGLFIQTAAAPTISTALRVVQGSLSTVVADSSGTLTLAGGIKIGTFTAGTISAVGDVLCFRASNTLGDCATSAANFVGVASATSGAITPQTAGTVTLNLDATASPQHGWYACTSAITAGKVTAQSSPCAQGQQVGILTSDANNVTSAPVFLAFK
jgi:hypothetical protein